MFYIYAESILKKSIKTKIVTKTQKTVQHSNKENLKFDKRFLYR